METNQSTELVRLEELYGVLVEDVAECDRRLAIDDNQFGRRNFVRSALALVEGVTYALRYESYHLRPRQFFSDAEAAVLLEKAYCLDDSGHAIEQPTFVRLKSNLRFTFQIFARACNSKFKLDIRSLGWQALLATIKVRDRLWL